MNVLRVSLYLLMTALIGFIGYNCFQQISKVSLQYQKAYVAQLSTETDYRVERSDTRAH